MSSFIIVKPMSTLGVPPPRPSPVSPARRNLFGSPPDGWVDAVLAEENESSLKYVKSRYNIDLRQLEEAGDKCNQKQISTEIVTIERCGEKMTKSICIDAERKRDKFAASTPYTRPHGIKGTFRVRKTHNGNSNVPKRKINQNNNNNNININNNNNENNNNHNNT